MLCLKAFVKPVLVMVSLAFMASSYAGFKKKPLNVNFNNLIDETHKEQSGIADNMKKIYKEKSDEDEEEDAQVKEAFANDKQKVVEFLEVEMGVGDSSLVGTVKSPEDDRVESKKKTKEELKKDPKEKQNLEERKPGSIITSVELPSKSGI